MRTWNFILREWEYFMTLEFSLNLIKWQWFWPCTKFSLPLWFLLHLKILLKPELMICIILGVQYWGKFAGVNLYWKEPKFGTCLPPVLSWIELVLNSSSRFTSKDKKKIMILKWENSCKIIWTCWFEHPLDHVNLTLMQKPPIVFFLEWRKSITFLNSCQCL